MYARLTKCGYMCGQATRAFFNVFFNGNSKVELVRLLERKLKIPRIVSTLGKINSRTQEILTH